MGLEGTQLARAMLSIHELEMSQAARHPGTLLSERIERRAMFHQRGNGMLKRVGDILERAGHRLQKHDLLPQELPLGKTVAQR